MKHGIKINARFKLIQFDKTRYKRALAEAVQKEFKEALRAFLKEAISRIPVYTGTSIGSLRKIALFLDEEIQAIPLANRKNQGVDVGEMQSFFNFDTSDPLRPKVSYQTGVLQLRINDEYDANAMWGFHLLTPGPYNAFVAARMAFVQYLRQNLKKNVPKLKRFQTETRQRTDWNNG